MASLQGLASNLIGNVASQNYATFQQSFRGAQRPVVRRTQSCGVCRRLDPENPVPNPELGPLERRVSVTFEEGLALDTVDKEAMEYWFTEPPQGWSTEKRILKKVQGFPVDEIWMSSGTRGE
eukprot:jgi/Picre1/33634/NNA_001114.t1